MGGGGSSSSSSTSSTTTSTDKRMVVDNGVGVSSDSSTVTVNATDLGAIDAAFGFASGSGQRIADRHGLPRDLLARLLWQESRYREDIITGRTRSSVGALGIAQFMPATAADFGVDPLEPFQAIEGAARYLGQLFRQFGNWPEALAAYNWGPGNVKRKGLAAAPLETRNYYTQILADIGGAAYA